VELDNVVLASIEGNEKLLRDLEKDIWDHPQVGFYEDYAAQLLSGVLENAGFQVKRQVASLPTAFIAEWGSGKPVIGVLGEYDALPGMSQQVGADKKPVEQGAPGHACGHNLLGVAGIGAVLALKHAMETHGVEGTIRYYGCPAEETLIGKVFMARDGVFDDLDTALTWHPFYLNTLWNSESMAMDSVKLNFHGVSAHAANAPHLGRSALDAVMLTEVGVNFMREHMIPDARIHCVVTHGGEAPNIVPSYSQVWYYVRAPKRPQVDELYQRLLNIAQGATLMTETTHDVQLIAGCYEYMPNRALNRAIMKRMKQLGPPEFDGADMELARQLRDSLPPEQVESAVTGYRLSREEVGDPLCTTILESAGGFMQGEVMAGSTDVGDVSYITPTGQFTTCCIPLGTAIHSWQSCASAGSGIGYKGMMLASKVLALTGLDLLTNPELVKEAKEELSRVTGGRGYASPLPDDVQPPTRA